MKTADLYVAAIPQYHWYYEKRMTRAVMAILYEEDSRGPRVFVHQYTGRGPDRHIPILEMGFLYALFKGVKMVSPKVARLNLHLLRDAWVLQLVDEVEAGKHDWVSLVQFKEVNRICSRWLTDVAMRGIVALLNETKKVDFNEILDMEIADEILEVRDGSSRPAA
jgi:hypothetical protein